MSDAAIHQREYYERTAESYEDMHLHENDEHMFALSVLDGLTRHLEIKTLLDVGSGTGRAIRFIKRNNPSLHAIGIEPVAGLRQKGYDAGLTVDELIDGDGMCLPYDSSSFDLVCEFGVLHHVREPQKMLGEMLRVAKKAVFVSDSNNFGQGRPIARTIKQLLNFAHLWPLADLIKTQGKGYTVSDEDGIAYSYSIYNDLNFLKKNARAVHVMNTRGFGGFPYRHCDHLAVLVIK